MREPCLTVYSLHGLVFPVPRLANKNANIFKFFDTFFYRVWPASLPYTRVPFPIFIHIINPIFPPLLARGPGRKEGEDGHEGFSVKFSILSSYPVLVLSSETWYVGRVLSPGSFIPNKSRETTVGLLRMNLVVNGRIGSQKLTQNNLQELMIIT